MARREDDYDRALGHATRELANLEGMIYVVAARLSGLSLPEVHSKLAPRTMGQLVREAQRHAKNHPRLKDETRASLLDLLERADRLTTDRNDLLHSGHAYRARDGARVLVLKSGQHPENLGVDGEIAPATFDGLGERAHELHLEFFSWLTISPLRPADP